MPRFTYPPRIRYVGGDPEVRVVGGGGDRLTAGTVLTGADARAVEISNGLVKVINETPSPDVDEQDGGTMLWRMTPTGYQRMLGRQYLDWTFPGASVTSDATEAEIVHVDSNLVVMTLTWAAFPLLNGGPPAYGPAYQLVYPEEGKNVDNTNYVKIPSTRFKKTIAVRRGIEGYFVGYHWSPRLGPEPKDRETYENETAFAERENGLGAGVRRAFASTGNTALFPENGQSAEWAAAEAALGEAIENHSWWPGLSDTRVWESNVYTAPQKAAFRATQPAGFPARQAAGPWWLAAVMTDHDTTGAVPYSTMRTRIEAGVWQYGADYGAAVIHFINAGEDAAGRRDAIQIFHGATLQTIEDVTDPPPAEVIDVIAARASAVSWPGAGW